VKTQRIAGSPDKLVELMEEYLSIGYSAELDGDELVVYYGQAPKRQHKPKGNDKPEKWSKRERNFGFTRG